MIAVQSLWLPEDGEKPQNPEQWRDNLRQIKSHYPKVLFWGNGRAIEWARAAGCTYDSTFPLPDYPAQLRRAWSIGKLYAAAQMTEPFIHVDGDVTIHRRLDTGGAAFFCQGIEPWIYGSEWWATLGVSPIPMPHTPRPASWNFGVFGGAAWQSIAAACRTAHDFALANAAAIAAAPEGFLPAVVIEQIWVPSLLAISGILPRGLLRPNRWKEDFAAQGFSHWLPHGAPRS